MKNLCFLLILVAGFAAYGQELDDLLGESEEEPSDDLLGAAKRAAAERKRKKEAEEAAAAAVKAKAQKEARAQAETLKEALKHLDTVEHPRVLMTPERLALIREKIKEPGSHWQLAHAAMVERSGRDPNEVWGGNARKGYWPVYASREAAFLSLVAEDPAERRRYAALAAKHLPTLDYVQWFGFKSKSLGHAMATLGTALTYDWAYNEWTDEERLKCELLLEYFQKHWEKYRRVSESNVTEYNFYGVLYGAETMLHLAMGNEERSKRFPVCVRVLKEHLAAVGGELGAHGEGIGYTEYPAGFSLPAAIALAQHGEPGPLEAAKTHEFWTLNMYVQTFMTSYARKFVQYGVSHCSNGNEGFASLVLGLCPPERMPYYLWFYDRHMGRLAKAEAARRFDSHRGNGGFSMVCYPDGVVAKDPTGTLPKMVYDSHGFWFFRNRWKDKNDIQCAILGDLKKNHGWGQPEQLNIRLMAYDTSFIGGPGKERGMENYSTLLVDGKYGVAEKGVHKAGEVVVSEARDDGGYVIVGAGALYEKLGVQRAQRHLLVEFSDPEANTAILSTLDEVTSGAEHTYAWQANLGPEGVEKPPEPMKPKKAKKKLPMPSPDAVAEEKDDGLSLDDPDKPVEKEKEKAREPEPAEPKPNDDGVISTSGTESGRPFFLLKGRNGYVKCWVLHPADAAIKTGDPLQVTTKGTNAKIWVVMYVGAGEPAEGVVEGTGMDSVLSVSGRKVAFDGNRIECK